MSIAEYTIRKSTASWVVVVLVLLGGMLAFSLLGRYEDPEFTIKQALVITQYPGATAEEVANEVTEHVESAIQQMPQLEKVTSQSTFGRSIVTAEFKDTYNKESLPQVWDELRHRIGDMQNRLPPGAGPSVVNDDYSDVYGLFFAITGEGYDLTEIYDFARDLRKQLLQVEGVAKIAFWGEPQEQVQIIVSPEDIARSGLSPQMVVNKLQQKNTVTPAGTVRAGDLRLQIVPKGGFDSVQSIEQTLIGNDPAGSLMYVGDIAEVRRTVKSPPDKLLQYDGKPAVGLGISVVSGGNIVTLGRSIEEHLAKLESEIPVGIDLHKISYQTDDVDKAINDFLVSLMQAVGIVIATLLIFMGLKSGFLIGFVLLLTVSGTFIFMYLFSIDLQRISLGALVIALGMMVDNAIVVTEGVLVRTQRGMKAMQAIGEVVSATLWPLLGGTIIGFTAFSAIGLSPDSTGEYAGSLFWVVLISLLLSWVFAITVTPLVAVKLFKPAEEADENDAYKGILFTVYRAILGAGLRYRLLTLALMIGLLVLAVIGFGSVGQSFFPASSRPQFAIDLYFPEGTDISMTNARTSSILEHIAGMEGVTHTTAFVGSGALRFMLTYDGQQANSSYSQILVDVDDFRQIDRLQVDIQSYLDESYPEAMAKVWRFALGPGGGSKIEVQYKGPDPDVLRRLADEAKAIMRKHPNALAVKDNWREPVQIMQPVVSETFASRVGLSQKDINESLQFYFGGVTVGTFRDGDKLLPIVGKVMGKEELGVDDLRFVQVWNASANTRIPVRQAMSEFNVAWNAPTIRRENRVPVIKAQSDPRTGLASDLLEDLKTDIEAIELPSGYSMEWKGEAGDSSDAQGSLIASFPLAILAMWVITVFLFNALRQPAIIWLTVPLILIGIVGGLLLVPGSNFDFMALLGLLSLTGMLIKNAIVLVDQMDQEMRDGKHGMQAINDAAISRLRPVMMGTLTTVLGMIPLLADPFYTNMAITIMAGLTFATVLTLVVVPVLYSLFFGISQQRS